MCVPATFNALSTRIRIAGGHPSTVRPLYAPNWIRLMAKRFCCGLAVALWLTRSHRRTHPLYPTEALQSLNAAPRM